MNRASVFILLILLPVAMHGQAFSQPSQFSILKAVDALGNNDFPGKKKDTTISLTHKKHSPKTATLLSAILPGAGQAYNRKYWKIPVVYALLGGSTWFMLKNKDSMLRRQNALKAMLDNDPNTVPNPVYAKTSVEQLKADRNYYRANRDYSIIAMAAFYLINIADATVDAHFYNFNIDKPLALQKIRHWYFSSGRVMRTPTVGLAFRF